ncbi:hypothetical protein CDAR_415451 [Caerostris darwini]|uniref:Uncharacterized protein n=1 Tax=Caerostris darwini TaxID=1538125 RepID=A0AAV4MLM0_9ARAC|nr:hypothetical protein CDAR_415451 [Caerostris darwini]
MRDIPIPKQYRKRCLNLIVLYLKVNSSSPMQVRLVKCVNSFICEALSCQTRCLFTPWNHVLVVWIGYHRALTLQRSLRARLELT